MQETNHIKFVNTLSDLLECFEKEIHDDVNTKIHIYLSIFCMQKMQEKSSWKKFS